MADKKGKDKTRKKEVRRSLKSKTFFITLLLAMGIGAAVLVTGFMLYLVGVVREYYVNTWNQANSEAAVLEQTNYKDICDEIIRIYDSMTPEERGDGKSPEYIAKYDSVLGEDFTNVQLSMHSLQDRNGPLNAFIVAMDPVDNRMIYMIDADMAEATTCRPGTWDDYPHDQIMKLITETDVMAGKEDSRSIKTVQAVYTNREGFGPRITAGATLFSTDNYKVLICVDEKLDTLIKNSVNFLIQYICLLLLVTFIAAYIGRKLMSKELVEPIDRMAQAAADYGSDKDKEPGERYFADLDIHTGDELERLANTLSDMETDIEEYMSELTRETADRERIRTELSLAAKIQKSMLTEEFPAFPDRTEFDIFASMEPAKEVGGDFYDMILLDDDHLLIEIADVSGKGVPAALFMMATKIVIANLARNEASPAKILERANNLIYTRNQEEMFVTIWLGILEISTGRIITANAGHEYPIIIDADGEARIVKDNHGFVVGGMDGMKYPEQEMVLKKGDRLFVYTDGVTEATNTDMELYGIDRLVRAAGSAGKGADPYKVLRTVRGSVADFVGDAEQFDDLTMLCLEYKGRTSKLLRTVKEFLNDEE